MDRIPDKEKKKTVLSHLYCRVVLCILILLAALCIRLLDYVYFSELKTSYDKHISQDMSISLLQKYGEKIKSIFVLKEENTKPDTNEQQVQGQGTIENSLLVSAEDTQSDTDVLFKSSDDESKESDKALPAMTAFQTDIGTSQLSFLKESSLSRDEEEDADEVPASSSINSMTVAVQGSAVTDVFGPRIHPITGKSDFHGGVDLAVDEGEPIVAALAGTVRTSSYDDISGYYVILTHQNGVETLYAHCSRIVAKEGDVVKQGQKIAEVGSTGSATGPHVHFEIRVNGKKINPQFILSLDE